MRFTLLILLLGLVPAVPAQNLQQALGSVANQNGLIGMSVVAICNGQVTDVVHTGQSDLQRGIVVGDSTRYRIASISKLVTAIGLMRLWEQGAFGLDDDVSTALGFTLRNPAYPNTPITYRMLLSHRSSLQDGTGYSDFLSATYATAPPPPISQLVAPGGTWYTADLWRTEAPGTYFTYSNLNFGVIGTLIEALSGERFDVYMRQQVLQPLGIGGSYNVQDLNDLDHLAVLYRNSIPQADDLGGVMPVAPDLSLYVPGNNGLFFAPQGGLRASALELARIALLLEGAGTWNGITVLQPATVTAMFANEWTWNGSNGDNYYGLFRSWGLGVHRITAQTSGDVVFPGTLMFGHAGEAYGLISDLYIDPATGFGLVFLTNGYTPGNAYGFGSSSAFYGAEEDVFAALANYAAAPCSTLGIASPAVLDDLRVQDRTLFWSGAGPLSLDVFDLTGRMIASSRLAPGEPWRPSSNVPLIIRARSQEGGYRTVRLF
jgi:CubicO group peptidase (beta-lactamase class C family)